MGLGSGYSSLSGLGKTAAEELASDALNIATAYRPYQWGVNSTPVTITVPSAYVPPSSTTATIEASKTINSSGEATVVVNTNRAANPPTVYVFDAVMELDHDQQLRMTEHPVQTGADISSHAYLMPATLSMTVLMSDSVDQYASSGLASKTLSAITGATTAAKATPWTGNPSKSVSAYQQMIAIQATRAPLIISTRLRSYTNMMITSIQAPENYKTYGGAQMRITFGQIRTASISNSQPVVSARTQDTESTPLGSVTPTAVPATTTKQFNINDYGETVPVQQSQVQGATAWSSSITTGLSALSAVPGVH